MVEIWKQVYVKDAQTQQPIAGANVRVNFTTLQGNTSYLVFTTDYSGMAEVYTINPNLVSIIGWEASAADYDAATGNGTPPDLILLATSTPPPYEGEEQPPPAFPIVPLIVAATIGLGVIVAYWAIRKLR